MGVRRVAVNRDDVLVRFHSQRRERMAPGRERLLRRLVLVLVPGDDEMVVRRRA